MVKVSYSFDKTLDLPARSCMLLIRGHTKENQGLSSHRNLFYRLAFSYNSNLHVEAAKYYYHICLFISVSKTHNVTGHATGKRGKVSKRQMRK